MPDSGVLHGIVQMLQIADMSLQSCCMEKQSAALHMAFLTFRT